MANKADPGPGNVQFDVPDDVFEENDDETATPDPDVEVEAKEDKKAEPVKAKKEEPEPEEVEEPELPPSEPPSDPAYLLAEERARRIEIEARMAALEASTRKDPAAAEADEDRAVQARKVAVRQKAMQAVRDGDEAGRQEAMWELSDLEREEYRRDSARQLRELRSVREPAQQAQQGMSHQQRTSLEAETFRAAYRVTSEEERKMEAEWSRYTSKNPAWSNARPWSKFQKALELVRKRGGGGESAMVEGGQHAAPSRSAGGSKATAELGARMFGVDVETYKKVVGAHRKGAR